MTETNTFTNFLKQEIEKRENESLNFSDALATLQDDLDEEIPSENGFLKEDYDFYAQLKSDNKKYVGSEKVLRPPKNPLKFKRVFEQNFRLNFA